MIKTKWAVAVLLALGCMSANAGSQVGKVTGLLVRATDGLVYFEIEGGVASDKPACAARTYWIIRDENSEVGKKQYAMLLAAQASGRELAVRGMNTCDRWGDGEDVNWLQLR